jgi:hypothetical protein
MLTSDMKNDAAGGEKGAVDKDTASDREIDPEKDAADDNIGDKRKRNRDGHGSGEESPTRGCNDDDDKTIKKEDDPEPKPGKCTTLTST